MSDQLVWVWVLTSLVILLVGVGIDAADELEKRSDLRNSARYRMFRTLQRLELF